MKRLAIYALVLVCLPKSVTEKMGKEVTVTGKVYTAGGNTFLTVDSVK